MRKRHLNNDFTAHNSLYHLQKGLNGTSIQIVPLRCTYGKLRCNGMDYIGKRIPQKEGINTLQEKREREREREREYDIIL